MRDVSAFFAARNGPMARHRTFRMIRYPAAFVFALLALAAGSAHRAAAQSAEVYDQEPIRYSTSAAADAVAALQARIDKGEVKLDHDGRRGYLDALLKELSIPVSSQ